MKKFDGSKINYDKNQSIIQFSRKSIRTVLLSLMLALGLSTTGFAFGKGSEGPDVFVVQGMLKSIGSYSGKITGHYNSLTVKGVRYFQRTHGLPVTGAVDKATFESISYAYAVVKFNAGNGAENGAGNGGGTGG
ncbi:peptidoglycan-binding domain-containing protein, partial [Bacillus sp. JJ664]